MINYTPREIKNCPNCGAQPTIVLEHWGNAYSAICSNNCGFPKIRRIEASATAAMNMWHRDIENDC